MGQPDESATWEPPARAEPVPPGDATLDPLASTETAPAPATTVEFPRPDPLRAPSDPPATLPAPCPPSEAGTEDGQGRSSTRTSRFDSAHDTLSFDLNVPGSENRPNVPGFEIYEELGRGTFGVVYLAHQTSLGRLVALKMVLYRAQQASDVLDRFQTDARSLARLKHPNIVQIHAVGEHQGLPYIVLEYVEGGTLAEAIRGKEQTTASTVELMEPLARAVAYAHEQGILHRDLKPGNILLAADGTPKIADFGLAKSLEPGPTATLPGSVLGTPAYMAPEQARGGIDIAEAADQYALGAILYELLTGRPPFLGQSPQDTLEQVKHNDVVPPSRLQPHVDPTLEAICLKCLRKEPARRFAKTRELADDLERFRLGLPTQTRPVSAHEWFSMWCRRNRKIAVLSAAVLGLLLVVAIVSTVAAIRIKHYSSLAEDYAVDASRGQWLALTTYREVLGRFDSALVDRPDLAWMRRDLLLATKQRIEELKKTIRRKRDDGVFPEADRYLAGSLQRLADLHVALGEPEEALADYIEARDLLDVLLARDPRNGAYLRNSAAIRVLLGDFHLNRFNAKAARDFYAQALSLRERWAEVVKGEAAPQPDIVRHALAKTRGALALASLHRGDPATAGAELKKEQDLRKSLSEPYRQGTENVNLRREEAAMHDRLGEVAFKRRDPIAAIQEYKAALAIRETLPDPKSLGTASDLALSDEFLGDVNLYLNGAADISRMHFDAALARLQALEQEFPKSLQIKNAIARNLYRLGEAYRQMHQPEESRAFFERSRAIRAAIFQDMPEDTEAQVTLALVLARCGDYDRALELAHSAQVQASKDPGALFNVACAFAQCAGARPNAASEAVKALEQAAEHGWEDAVSLETDPDLKPIQGNDAFRGVVENLKRKSTGAPR
jgi:serine/threonine protein kinase